MDLEELRAFLQVAESGSFLAAAESLGVSRTTLRRRVGSLEARAGVPLLESTQHGVLLTEAGRALARGGQALTEEAGALLTSIREVGQEPAGVLKVSLPVGLPPHLLNQLFAALRAAHPRLTVETRFSEDPVAESLAGADLAVHFSEAPPRGTWLSPVIVRLREWLFASAGYLARRGTPHTIEDLAGHELLAWQPPGEDPRAFPLCHGGTFPVAPALVTADIHFLRHCARAGLGICLAPDGQLPDPDETEPLVPVLPEIVGRERALRVTVPRALAEVPKIRAVLDHIVAATGGER
jgi:DNA-binding transcriptional LysR family regulator